MTPEDHDWRHADARAIDRKVVELNQACWQLEHVHAIFEDAGDQKAATEVRSLLGLLRERGAGYIDHARALRTAARDEPRPEAHRAGTVRRVS